MNKEQLAELLDVFRDEASESLNELRVAMEDLDVGGDATKLRECLRLAHNLKGAAATVGLEDFSVVAYLLEEFFAGHAEHSGLPDSSALLAALGALSELERLFQGEPARQSLDEWRLQLQVGPRPSKPAQPPPRPSLVATPELALAKPPDGDELVALSPLVEAELAAQKPEEAKFLRVDVERLAQVQQESEELLSASASFLARGSQYAKLSERLAELIADQPPEKRARFNELLGDLNQIRKDERRAGVQLTGAASALDGALRKLRMTRLESLAGGWRRIVADAAERLGKEVRLQLDVGDVEIDKRVLDRLHLPLIHLLRNAVAHGIEPPEVRFDVGKPRRGQLKIAAEASGTEVRLTIEDDGVGIDVDRVRKRAIALGRLPKVQSISFELAASLLFEPGFSTTGSADLVSGRGVGLDDVQAALVELGGRISVRPGSMGAGGTCFELRFPVSVLSTRGLLVREAGQTYALPLVNVERTLRLPASAVSDLDGGLVVEVGAGKTLPLRTLSQLLGGQRAAQAQPDVVIVRANRGQLAVCVDEVLWEAQFIVKPMPWNLMHVSHIGGMAALTRTAGAHTEAVLLLEPRHFRAERQAQLPARGSAARQVPRVLVVDDSVTRRTLHLNLMRNAGYEVDAAVDGAQAWQKLQDGGFDLLISDVQMPQLDGLELTRKVRASEQLGHLPVVLVTGLAGDDDERRGLDAGANAYVVKQDFAQDQLLQVVSELLELAA